MAALNHPHIVTLYSVEEAEGIPFLTMELAEGDNLQQALAEGKPTPDEVVAIGSRLARPWPPPTPKEWCTATSSRPTSW